MRKKSLKGSELIPKTRLLYLSFKKTAHNMAQVLGFRRLQDYLHGRGVLSGSPVWLLGKCYKGGDDHDTEDPLPEEVQKEMIEDFASRIWMTYRSGFSDLGSEKFNSDVGWGCTIRSGQMLLAQAVLHHVLGRNWRRNIQEQSLAEDRDIWSIVECFLDNDGQPLSIHNICSVGEKHGVEAGRWLGPWALSHVLEDLVNSYRPHGLKVLLISQPGGGAPYLNKARVCEYLAAFQDDSNGDVETMSKLKQSVDISIEEIGRDSKSADITFLSTRSRADSSMTDWELTEEVINPEQLKLVGKPGLIVLIPLVLGIEKVDDRYLKQLKVVMEWPQSLGIVGGRPSSSLYFIGYQDENIIYLDPHDDQEVATSGNSESYFCHALRHMPISAIDPSLTIGFFCDSQDSFQDLVDRLERLEKEVSCGVPLVNVTNNPDASLRWDEDLGDTMFSTGEDDGTMDNEEDWEMVYA